MAAFLNWLSLPLRNMPKHVLLQKGNMQIPIGIKGTVFYRCLTILFKRFRGRRQVWVDFWNVFLARDNTMKLHQSSLPLENYRPFRVGFLRTTRSPYDS